MNYNEANLKIFLRYLSRHKTLFFLDMSCAVLVAVIDLVFPYASRSAMNALLPQKLFGAFFAVMAVLVLSYVLKSVLYYVITVLGHKMGVLTEADMRRDLFAHLQEAARPPDSYWNSRHADIILNRMRELYPEIDCTTPEQGLWYEL